MNETKKKTRRRYGAEPKQQILAQCTEPGASVASVALSHGTNANVVHKWRRQPCGGLPLAYRDRRLETTANGCHPIWRGLNGWSTRRLVQLLDPKEQVQPYRLPRATPVASRIAQG